MTFPTATYRLQFREGIDFDAAAGLAPYLARLGISHLYASPIFQASRGSTHGYDVTDHGVLDEALGGMAGFLRMSDALRTHGLGLILDIVPNHMAATPENPWWYDVLRHGGESRFAGHFDIDWSAPKLLLPILGGPYGTVLDAGELCLGHDSQGLTLRYYEHAFPLEPATWHLAYAQAPRPQEFAVWIAAPENAAALAAALGGAGRDTIHRVHEAQAWRLVYWRAARDMLTYRRFFEIADLVGVRVEEPAVFDDVHRLVLELVRDGHVQGLRVDHVDGLADPRHYLERLAGATPGVPVWVEKILGAEEELPRAWPVEGTTGYELAGTLADVLTDPAAEAPLDTAYTAFAGEKRRYDELLHAAKREIIARNLAAELDLLARLAGEAAEDDLEGRDWGTDTLRRALAALMAAMPVYRTYLDGRPPEPEARALLDAVVAEASRHTELDDPSPIRLVARLLAEGRGAAAARFRTRLQQTTGALMAKAVEDTLFYRFNRLISANEVGAEPVHIGLRPDAFHARMARRMATQPHGLSATATHDTKRGEDARMRIAAISEDPEGWIAAVGRFDRLVRNDPTIPEPDANTRWLFYQALLGSWDDDEALGDRLAAYLLKAERERKRHTSWLGPDPDYEERLETFARRTLASRPFRAAFAEAAGPFIRTGGRKSLAQLALKLTVPGIPDIYQGTELDDLSFVDPDNRRPVDFPALDACLGKVGATCGSKLALMRFGLELRRRHPALFDAPYEPLPMPGRLLGFARRVPDAVLVVAVDTAGGMSAPTQVRLPEALHGLGIVASFPGVPDETLGLDLGAVLAAHVIFIGVAEPSG